VGEGDTPEVDPRGATTPATVPGGGNDEGVRLQPGKLLAGRYAIVRLLGQGGMGDVYEAEDRILHERVALKTIRPAVARDERHIARFKRELQLARKVTHENVCRTFDLGFDDEATFLTMELLEGETLADVIRKRAPLAPADALPFARQIAAGLDAAHRAGVVHRDLKPSTIMIVDGQRVVITDFGLARAGDPDADASRLTAGGQLLGTPTYMAPEQVEGREAGPPADVYAFGISLYEMVTGRVPFDEPTPLATATKRLGTPPDPPRRHVPALAAAWDQTIMRCLALAPEDRYARAGDAIAALGGRARFPRFVAAGFLAVVALAALVIGGAVLLRRADAPPRRAAASATAPSKPIAAVLRFANQGERVDDWLGAAVADTLEAELDGDGVEVAPVASELRVERDASVSREVRQRLAEGLGVRWLVVGTVAAAGDSVTVHARLVAASDGFELGVVDAHGSRARVGELAARLAGPLRAKMGVGSRAAPERRVLPTDAEAARLYTEGLARFAEADYVGARDLLRAAIAREETFGPAHAARARDLMWQDDVKAAEAACRRALELGGLSSLERQRTEATLLHYGGSTAKAASMLAAVYDQSSDIFDGLELANAQDPKESLATLERLRKLPAPLSEDPNIDLQEAVKLRELADLHRALAAASRARVRAKKLGRRIVAIDAALIEAQVRIGLKDLAEAATVGAEALAESRPLDYYYGISTSLWVLFQAAQMGGEHALAEAKLVELREFFKARGPVDREAGTLTQLAMIRVDKRRFAEARAALDEAAALEGQRPDLGLLQAYRRLHQEMGATGEAVRASREIVRLRRERPSPQLAQALSDLAESLVRAHEPAKAQVAAEEAHEVARRFGHKGEISRSLAIRSNLKWWAGDLEAAIPLREQAVATYEDVGDRDGVFAKRNGIAWILFDAGRLDEAEALIRKQIEATDPGIPAHAASLTLLARLHLRRGERERAEAVLDRAQPLVKEDGTMSFAWFHGVRARSSGDPARAAESLRELRRLLAEAERTQDLWTAFELRISVAEAELAQGQTAAARARLRAVDRDARAWGFPHYAKRVQALLVPSARR
jgi:eukaryotic-like serine/threonine-protein kinase